MLRRLFIFTLAILLLFVGWILLKPIKTDSLTSNPDPVADYAAAVARVEALQATDGTEINPVCRTRFMTHDQRTERAIILIHGFTNCPQQFEQLGMQFHQRGYNVLIPRMPRHGLDDRLTTDLAQLTAEEMVALGDEVADIGPGLGEHVTLVGFSAGGVVAGWAAQQRDDIDQAVVMAPALGLGVIPAPLTKPAANLLLTLPNFFRWWDPELEEDVEGPPHAYPRFASRALGQVLRLGQAVLGEAGLAKPTARSILVVNNANEPAVNNDLIAELVEKWRSTRADDLRSHEFGADMNLGHDFIDPADPDQQIEVVYPILIDLID